jgi:hypothetical protein
MPKQAYTVDVTSRAVDAAEWDELFDAIANELTELGAKRLEYELFARRLESEVRDLTGLRGLVSDDFVADLLVRAQRLFHESDLPPSMPRESWVDFDDPNEVTKPATPRAIISKSGTHRIIDSDDEETRPGIPHPVLARYYGMVG